MRSNEAILVLFFKRRRKETIHEVKSLLLVLQKSASINGLEVKIEETLGLAAPKYFLEFSRLIGKQLLKADRFHVINWDGLAIPLDGFLGLG
jgi:hypothetical protein